MPRVSVVHSDDYEYRCVPKTAWPEARHKLDKELLEKYCCVPKLLRRRREQNEQGILEKNICVPRMASRANKINLHVL